MVVDIDAVFKDIGEFGPYQRHAYFLLCLPAIFVGVSNMAYVFIAAIPKYRCVVPQCDANVSNPTYYQPFLNFTIPYNTKDESWSECQRYQHLNTQHSCMPEDFSPNVTEGCPEGKVFATNIYTSTIVSEFNLTCSDSWKGEMSQTIYFSGVLVGSLIFGPIGDLIGRKMTLMIGVACMAVSGTVTALLSGLSSFYAFRFINAIMATGVFQISFVLGIEMVGPSMKVPCGIIIEYFYALGEVVLGLVSWWLRDWRMIQLVLSTPVSCFVLYWWLVPESPRWLQAKGKHEKVITLLKKIAEKNNKNIGPVLERNIGNEESNDVMTSEGNFSTKVTLLDIMKTPLLCVRMFFMFFIWIVVTLVYYGLSLNATTFGFENEEYGPFLDFIFSGLMEIPGYTLSWIGMAFCGRKKSLVLSMVLAGLSCGGAGFSQEYSNQFLLPLTLLGKCFITSAFGIIYVFALEIFPTSIRSTVLGLCSTFARVGSMLAPYSHDLEYIYGPLPLLVFGGLSLVGTAMIIVMPETLRTELPDSIEESLNLGRNVVQPSTMSEEEQPLVIDNEEDSRNE